MGGVSKRTRLAAVPKRPEARGTRARLLDAALALLSEGGYAAATVSNIAERVGVSAGALYRHFPSKAELFVEVFRAAAGRDLSVMRTVGSEGSAIARLARAIAAHARRALADPRLTWALIHEPVDPAVDAVRLAYRRRYARYVASVLEAAVEAGEIPAQDVTQSAAAIAGALCEALVGPLSPTSTRERDVDALVAHIVRFCRLAVGADAGSPTSSTAGGEPD